MNRFEGLENKNRHSRFGAQNKKPQGKKSLKFIAYCVIFLMAVGGRREKEKICTASAEIEKTIQ